MTADWTPGRTLDARDYTPAPPAELDPRWVLTMRKRLNSLDWPSLKASREQGAAAPRWEQ